MFDYLDCHAHIAEILKDGNCRREEAEELFSLLERNALLGGSDYSVLASCHSMEEFYAVSQLKEKFPDKIGISFGSLAQNPSLEVVAQLETLLSDSEKCGDTAQKIDAGNQITAGTQIDAIGECGIDLFTSELRSTLDLQREVFRAQIELAVRYQKPLVIHQRKAMAEIFSLAPSLSQVSAVLFHGYSGTAIEAQTILNKGVNAYFSFGKSVIRGDRKTAACLATLPRERLRFETDSPYQLPPQAIFDILRLCAKT